MGSHSRRRKVICYAVVMIIEAAALMGLPVENEKGEKLGAVEVLVFNGETTRLAGFGVSRSSFFSKTAGLALEDVISLYSDRVVVDSEADLGGDTKALDSVFQQYGRVLNVTAKTASGRKIGKVVDVFLEAQTGVIVRFYLRNMLKEQIIPRQFLVKIAPEQIVFKDIVDQPIFNQAANLGVGETEKALALSHE